MMILGAAACASASAEEQGGGVNGSDREKEVVTILDKLVKAEQARREAMKEKPQTIKSSPDTEAGEEKADNESEKDQSLFPGTKQAVKTEKKGYSKNVALNADEDSIDDLIDTIRRAAGVNIVTDSKAIAEGVRNGTVKTTITLRVDNMKLESALNWICRLSGLAWSLQDEAIFITTPDRIVSKTRKLKIYDIRDISMKVQDFPGPDLGLDAGSGSGGAVILGP